MKHYILTPKINNQGAIEMRNFISPDFNTASRVIRFGLQFVQASIPLCPFSSWLVCMDVR